MTEPRTTLRSLLKTNTAVLAPGVYDAMGALFAEQAGFDALYLSGASIAYSRLGRPDIGLFGLEELSSTVSRIRGRTELPLIVDADTGFGNAINVQHTVASLERAGASAIQIEDQAMPKRCGHLTGKTLVSGLEMVGKVKAALDARYTSETLIVARTDAVAVEGLDAALDRAEAYVDAGCDILFVEALRNEEDLATATKRFAGRVPLIANMVEGGQTPIRSVQALQDLGFSIVIFPGGLARAVSFAMRDYFASLKEHGTTGPFRDRMLDFDGLNAAIGTPEMLERGRRYSEEEETKDV